MPYEVLDGSVEVSDFFHVTIIFFESMSFSNHLNNENMIMSAYPLPEKDVCGDCLVAW
jgi:hypothetical protein